MEWLEETLHANWRQRLRIDRVIHRCRSDYQELVVIETRDFGRVLFLDGILQTSERDEFIYHEMITHVPIMAHGAVRDVLIIGGGDGGTLREALKHPALETATMVELDPVVVEVAREHLPTLSAGAFDDPRVELRFEDGIRFVAESKRQFDVIIVDSTDPIGPGEVLFSEAFYASCARCLRPGGVIATQSGNVFGDHVHIGRDLDRLRPCFPAVNFYRAALATYVGGDFVFGLASDAKDHVDPIRLGNEAAPAGLRYYSPAIHAASFVHPPWLMEMAESRLR